MTAEKKMTRLMAEAINSTPKNVLKVLKEARHLYERFDHQNRNKTCFDFWINVVESTGVK